MSSSCELCGKESSLLQANHREKGIIKVCRDCWIKLYDKNEMVGGSSSSEESTSTCATCGI